MPKFKPVDMVANKWGIYEKAEPLPSYKEQEVEEHMEDVLWEDQGVQWSTLIYWILVISFQLIKSNDLRG